MKRIFPLLLFAVGLSTGCAQPAKLSPTEFTEVYAETLRKADPTLQVTILGELQLKTTLPDKRELSTFLNNAYTLYEQDPTAKDEVIQRFVKSSLETIASLDQAPDRTAIVPVIKDPQWVTQMEQQSSEVGAKKAPKYVYEELNPDLLIVYAEDSPQNIKFLTAEDLDTLKIQRSELRALACANLERLLPKIEIKGDNGYYMLTAGGDYEASLLLIGSIWTEDNLKVEGETVVAIPTRDVLLVTGSRDTKGLKKMREVVKAISAEGAYLISEKLFVRRNGKLEEFTE